MAVREPARNAPSRTAGSTAKLIPPDSRWTTDAEYEAITAYFQLLAADKGFNVVRHERA